MRLEQRRLFTDSSWNQLFLIASYKPFWSLIEKMGGWKSLVYPVGVILLFFIKSENIALRVYTLLEFFANQKVFILQRLWASTFHHFNLMFLPDLPRCFYHGLQVLLIDKINRRPASVPGILCIVFDFIAKSFNAATHLMFYKLFESSSCWLWQSWRLSLLFTSLKAFFDRSSRVSTWDSWQKALWIVLLPYELVRESTESRFLCIVPWYNSAASKIFESTDLCTTFSSVKLYLASVC